MAMKSNKTRILFDRNGKDWILSVFDKSLDAEGFIIDNKTGDKIMTPEGKEITGDQLAVIFKGSEKFVPGDLTSLMKLTKGEL